MEPQASGCNGSAINRLQLLDVHRHGSRHGEQSQTSRASNTPDADRVSARSAGDSGYFRHHRLSDWPASLVRCGLLHDRGGIVGGLIAAVFGLIDWLAIPAGTRAKAIGAWHGGGNVLVVLLF